MFLNHHLTEVFSLVISSECINILVRWTNRILNLLNFINIININSYTLCKQKFFGLIKIFLIYKEVLRLTSLSITDLKHSVCALKLESLTPKVIWHHSPGCHSTSLVAPYTLPFRCFSLFALLFSVRDSHDSEPFQKFWMCWSLPNLPNLTLPYLKSNILRFLPYI